MSASKTETKLSPDSGNPNAGVSICIPRIFSNIGWRRVKRVFVDLNWGFVERVDVVARGGHKRAFVHFGPGRWNQRDSEAQKVLKALQRGAEIKVFYEFDTGKPWYWLISLSRAVKPAEAPRPKPRPKVQIETEEASTNSRSALLVPRVVRLNRKAVRRHIETAPVPALSITATAQV